MEEKKYDATYRIGKSTIYVVCPPPLSEEEADAIFQAFHVAGWAIIRGQEKGGGQQKSIDAGKTDNITGEMK